MIQAGFSSRHTKPILQQLIMQAFTPSSGGLLQTIQVTTSPNGPIKVGDGSSVTQKEPP